jgi:hypothetical protein
MFLVISRNLKPDRFTLVLWTIGPNQPGSSRNGKQRVKWRKESPFLTRSQCSVVPGPACVAGSRDSHVCYVPSG